MPIRGKCSLFPSSLTFITGWSRPVWAWLAEQGYLAVAFAEVDGGLGGGAVETMIIGEACGGHLFAEPYLATIVAAGTALRLSANAALRRALIPRIAAGEIVAAFADDEPPPAAGRAPMTAVPAGDGGRCGEAFRGGKQRKLPRPRIPVRCAAQAIR